MDNLPPSNFRSTIFWVRLGAFVLFSLVLFHLASCGGGNGNGGGGDNGNGGGNGDNTIIDPPPAPSPPDPEPPPAPSPPDLVIALNSVSDNTLTTGQRFILSVTVRNQGTGRADTTTLRYKRAGSLPIVRGDSTVGRDSVSSLSPSESSSESIILTAPLTAGIYYYGACVDSVNGEKNLDNNCSPKGVQVTVRSIPSAGRATLHFRIRDQCNDGYDFEYKFFETINDRHTGNVWPAPGIYYTRGLGTVNTSSLSCRVGTKVCYGGRRRKSNPTSYWGIGIDGNKGCSNCCYSCPSSGQVSTTKVHNIGCP